MIQSDVLRVARQLGVEVRAATPLSGGFSHRTVLVDTDTGPLVMRFGLASAELEAAVMRRAAGVVPVPEVRLATQGCLVSEYVSGTVLEQALRSGVDPAGLGRVVGDSLSRLRAIEFGNPGFFGDASLTVEEPDLTWSQMLAQVAADCMRSQTRLDAEEQRRWLQLCRRATPLLAGADRQARLVHADANPKNVIVAHVAGAWTVAAWIDWEFAHAGCPYADAANMLRFSDDYPRDFVAGFRRGYTADRGDWLEIGRAFDLFSLSQLLTRPVGHPIGDRVEALVRVMLGG